MILTQSGRVPAPAPVKVRPSLALVALIEAFIVESKEGTAALSDGALELLAHMRDAVESDEAQVGATEGEMSFMARVLRRAAERIPRVGTTRAVEVTRVSTVTEVGFIHVPSEWDHGLARRFLSMVPDEDVAWEERSRVTADYQYGEPELPR